MLEVLMAAGAVVLGGGVVAGGFLVARLRDPFRGF